MALTGDSEVGWLSESLVTTVVKSKALSDLVCLPFLYHTVSSANLFTKKAALKEDGENSRSPLNKTEFIPN